MFSIYHTSQCIYINARIVMHQWVVWGWCYLAGNWYIYIYIYLYESYTVKVKATLLRLNLTFHVVLSFFKYTDFVLIPLLSYLILLIFSHHLYPFIIGSSCWKVIGSIYYFKMVDSMDVIPSLPWSVKLLHYLKWQKIMISKRMNLLYISGRYEIMMFPLMVLPILTCHSLKYIFCSFFEIL